MDLQELLDEACPIVNKVGWAFYFVPETVARGEALGLDQFRSTLFLMHTARSALQNAGRGGFG